MVPVVAEKKVENYQLNYQLRNLSRKSKNLLLQSLTQNQQRNQNLRKKSPRKRNLRHNLNRNLNHNLNHNLSHNLNHNLNQKSQNPNPFSRWPRKRAWNRPVIASRRQIGVIPRSLTAHGNQECVWLEDLESSFGLLNATSECFHLEKPLLSK